MSRWKPKYNYEDVVKLFESNGAEFLDSFYGNQHTVHNFKCSCGEISKTRVVTFKKKKQCGKCSSRKAGEKKSLGINKAREIFEEKGYTLLSKTYKNADSYMDALCVCGERYRFSITGVRKGNKCPKCVKERFTGSNNPRWNPNLTDKEREERRDTKENRDWRIKIFERDDYTCVECGDKGVELNAHHIIPFSVDKSKRFDIDNGITLCAKCHKVIHSVDNGIRIKDMNEDTFAEYSQREVYSPELEIDFNYETGEVCYNTFIS